MLPSGLQMPLLWFLLWMLKLGLSSALNPGDMMTSPVQEDRPSLHKRTLHRVTWETTEEDTDIDEFYKHDLTFVRMVDIKNGEPGNLGALQDKQNKI